MKSFLLKDIRENNDNTQQEIAEILKVKRGTYASWECGNDIIPIRKLYLFANYYQKSLDYIVGISDKKDKVICNKEIDLTFIGERLKTIRISNDLSQAKIAESIDINQSTWWAYEKGKTLITTTSAIALSQKYNYSIDWILARVK